MKSVHKRWRKQARKIDLDYPKYMAKELSRVRLARANAYLKLYETFDKLPLRHLPLYEA